MSGISGSGGERAISRHGGRVGLTRAGFSNSATCDREVAQQRHGAKCIRGAGGGGRRVVGTESRADLFLCRWPIGAELSAEQQHPNSPRSRRPGQDSPASNSDRSCHGPIPHLRGNHFLPTGRRWSNPGTGQSCSQLPEGSCGINASIPDENNMRIPPRLWFRLVINKVSLRLRPRASRMWPKATRI